MEFFQNCRAHLFMTGSVRHLYLEIYKYGMHRIYTAETWNVREVRNVEAGQVIILVTEERPEIKKRKGAFGEIAPGKVLAGSGNLLAASPNPAPIWQGDGQHSGLFHHPPLVTWHPPAHHPGTPPARRAAAATGPTG